MSICLTNKASCFSIKIKLLPHPLTINGRACRAWQEGQPGACVFSEIGWFWRPFRGPGSEAGTGGTTCLWSSPHHPKCLWAGIFLLLPSWLPNGPHRAASVPWGAHCTQRCPPANTALGHGLWLGKEASPLLQGWVPHCRHAQAHGGKGSDKILYGLGSKHSQNGEESTHHSPFSFCLEKIKEKKKSSCDRWMEKIPLATATI